MVRRHSNRYPAGIGINMAKLKLLILLLVFHICSGFSGVSQSDPFTIIEQNIYQSPILWQSNHGYTDTGGKTVRNAAINTGVKNLVLIIDGQSLMGAGTPTAYTVTNSGAIDNFNFYDGSNYVYSDPPLGSTWAYLALGGSLPTPSPGSLGGRIADKFITNGVFARVIVVPIAVGGTAIATHATGRLTDRIGVAIKRLASIGITPATTNVTFAILWGQGEGDSGTSTPAYTSALQTVRANAVAAGFSGRFFVNKETWVGGVVTPAVQAAQTGVVDNSTFWAGADMDSLNATNRIADNTHLNDTGAAAAATLIYNAMHASGAPF